jgi:hypothetical protein
MAGTEWTHFHGVAACLELCEDAELSERDLVRVYFLSLGVQRWCLSCFPHKARLAIMMPFVTATTAGARNDHQVHGDVFTRNGVAGE